MWKQKLRCYYWDSGEKYFYEVRWPFVPCYHALLCKDNCLLIKKQALSIQAWDEKERDWKISKNYK